MSSNGKTGDGNSESTKWPSLLPPHGKKSSASKLWRTASAVVIPSIAVLSKVWLNWFNSTRIKNRQVFLDTVNSHFGDRSYPLVTMSNHHSCMDDPGLWGALYPWRWIFNSDRHRWSAAAQDVCFTKTVHSIFFSMGKTFPLVRGEGIHQKGMDYVIDIMRNNDLLHYFPQGRTVDDFQEVDKLGRIPDAISEDDLKSKIDCISLRDSDFEKGYELKWGLAHAMMQFLGEQSSSSSQRRRILLLPFYHLGMNEALPNPTSPQQHYMPRFCKAIHVYIRDNGPLSIDQDYLKSVCFNGDDHLPLAVKRSLIMKHLEQELKWLKLKAIQYKQSLQS